MTVLTAQAVITAVDRASPVFARVSRSAQAAAQRFGTAAATVNQASNTMTVGLGAAAAFGGAFALQGEYEIDRLARLTQSAGELSNQQRRVLTEHAMQASMTTGIAAQEILKAQQALIQGGIGADTSGPLSTMFGMIARANGIAADTAAEDAINVARAMGFAMGTVEEQISSLTRAMEFMSVVPNLSTETWAGLRTSLKYAAPVAGALGIEITHLGAALSILADAGFKGEEGGTALRTILTRALAPTRAARHELRALGVSLEDIYNFEQATGGLGSRVGDMASFAERLRSAGLGQGRDAAIARVLERFNDPSRFGSLYAMQDAMQVQLAQALGIGRGDAESRGILMRTIQNHFRSAVGTFDIERFFTGISQMSIPGLKEMFGLQRISQAIALKNELNKIMELPNGQRMSRFRQLAQEFDRLMPGAIPRRFGPVSEGFAFSVDRMAASLANIRNTLFSFGGGDVLVRTIDGISSSIRDMAASDPGRLRAISLGIASIGAAAIAGGGIALAASGLRGITTALASPILGKLLMGGGIAALLGADFGALFQEPDDMGEFSRPVFLGPRSPIGQMMTAITGFAGETAQTGAAIADLVKSVLSLVGVEVEGSLLVNGFRLLTSVINEAAAGVKLLRENINDLAGTADPTRWRMRLPGLPESLQGLTVGNVATVLGALNASPSARRGDPMPSGGTPLFGLGPGGSLLGGGRVDVQGQANLDMQNEITVQLQPTGALEGLLEAARAAARTQGSAQIPLNTGQGMPDAGSGGAPGFVPIAPPNRM